MAGIRSKTLTFKLVSENREFGINIPAKEQIDIVCICGSISGRKEDKFKKTRLTLQKGKIIDSFMINECPVNIECHVVHQILFDGSHNWFIGEIKAVQIDEGCTCDKALMYWPMEYRSVGEILFKNKRKQ